MRYALGIDLGTGSTKAVLIDEAGDLVGRGQAEYPLYKPHPGGSSRTRRIGGEGCVRRRVRLSPILIQRRSPVSVCRGRSMARYLSIVPGSLCSGYRSGSTTARKQSAIGPSSARVTCCGNGH